MVSAACNSAPSKKIDKFHGVQLPTIQTNFDFAILYLSSTYKAMNFQDPNEDF